MKRFLLIVLAFGLSCTPAKEDPNPDPSKPPTLFFGKLKVTGGKLTDESGTLVQLRGVSYGWHNWWPRFYNSQTVAWFKSDWKANVLRAAMGVEPVGGYLTHPESALEKVEAVVEAAIQNDLYVIIDWHSHNIKTEEAVAFFSAMAKKYGHHPHVIYEIFNEPDYQTWADVKAYSIAVIDAIREHDPDNIILVGSPHWCQDLHIVADDPILGYDNLMYTLHFYAATHKQFLRDRAIYALNKGLPIFVSECASMEATGDGPIDEASWATWLNWMEFNKLSWILWSVSDKDETCSMLLPSAASTGNWAEAVIKPWGTKGREAIRSRHQ